MFQEGSITERHANRMLDDVLRPLLYGDSVSVPATIRALPGEPEEFDAVIGGDFEAVAPGDRWGRPWSTAWFHVKGEVPATFAGRRVELLVDLGYNPLATGFSAEGMLWTPNGRPLHGLHPRRQWSLVSDDAAGGEIVDLYVEAASNPTFFGTSPSPLGEWDSAGDAPLYTFRGARLAVVNAEIRGLVAALEFCVRMIHNQPREGPARPRLYSAIDTALARLSADDPLATAAAALEPLAALLSTGGAADRHHATAVGHAHIDTAWLWPLRETRRKCGRTFANQLQLIAESDAYVFGCSQAAQYEMVEHDYPGVFAGIVDAVAAGRWVPLGGSWVEADGNLPSGESLLRQHVHGQRYFLERFGRASTVGWIPDVFGYPAGLPQIMALAGIERFVTQKLSWNRTNTFPHHTFWWEGLDGTAVLTHFPPADTYNSEIEPSELARIDRNFRDHGWSRESLVVFGHGDGGGGPTREMLDRIDLAADVDGLPLLDCGSPEGYFDAVEAEARVAGAAVPRWRGELYFEMHRGTYTSQAKTKACNRRTELALREVELLSAMASCLTAGFEYPYDDLDRLWKDTLVLQFHDILPGSSIAWVHREAETEYERILSDVSALRSVAVEALSAGDAGVDGSGAGGAGGSTWWNPSPFPRTAVVDADGGPVVVSCPAMGTGDPETSTAGAGGLAPVRIQVGDDGSGSLDNGLLRVEWDGFGELSSIVWLASGREVVRKGARANRLWLYEDRPIEYDAWDIEPYYRHHAVAWSEVDEIRVGRDDGLVASVVITRTHGESTIVQELILRSGSARLDVSTDIDWAESNTMLKADFPVAVRADRASAEMQFGHVFRPTHVNTTWDLARFEVCAHRWIDISEPDFGVALLNDSKYGHDTLDGHLRLTLLRSAQFPDPGADIGRHRFTYALLPHEGDVVHSSVIAEGYALNMAMTPFPASVAPLVVSDHAGVVIETVKMADDRSGDVIVRAYESRGAHCTAGLGFAAEVGEISAVDALEQPFSPDRGRLAPETARTSPRTLEVTLRPFQVATLRVPPPHDLGANGTLWCA